MSDPRRDEAGTDVIGGPGLIRRVRMASRGGPGGEATGAVRVLSRVVGPDADVFERQLPFVVSFAVAVIVVACIPGSITHPGWAATSILVALTVPLLARVVPWRDGPPWAEDVLPLIQLVAVALLRFATGGGLSIIGALVFIPVVTLAGRPGRIGMVIGPVAVGFAVLAPVVLDPQMAVTATLLARSLFVAFVAATIAVIVHEATSRLRARNATLADLEREALRLNDHLRRDADMLAELVQGREAAYAHLVSVIDAVTEQAIIATDPEGRVEVFNPGAERLLGYRREEFVGESRVADLLDTSELRRRYSEVFGVGPEEASDADDPDLFAAVAAPSILPEARADDWTIVRRDGTRVTVNLSVTRRVDGHGSTIGYVFVATDVTAEREASRLKDEFVSLVSHELRTPLTSVLGYLELVLDGPDPLTDEQREFLTVVQRNARRQLRLVSDLLLTAQVDAGTFAIARQPMDVTATARSVLVDVAPVAEAAGVTVSVDGPPVPVEGDPQRLEQVFTNLISNAVKFTPRGGRIEVRVAPGEGGGARVDVSDTGIGIPPDELDRLATRFFRATTATRQAIPGVGLGLSIAKAVVAAHGGELTVSSTVGEGTTFTFTLPGS